MNNTPNNLLPFNWESYQQRTDKDTCVVTRDGRPVKLAGYNPEAQEPYQVIGWVDNMAYEWYPNGSLHGAHNKLNSDIFLKPEPVVVYKLVNPQGEMGSPHTSLDAAKEAKCSSRFHRTASSVCKFTLIDGEVIAHETVHRFTHSGHE